VRWLCRQSPCVSTLLPTAWHNRRAARIKEHCVDNAVGLDGQRRCRCVRQPEVKSKVDVLGAPPATAAKSVVRAEHRLNLTRSRKTDRENGYENQALVFSYKRSPVDNA